MEESIKRYTLMHKNIPVADLELDTASGAVTSVGMVQKKSHVPVGILFRKCLLMRQGATRFAGD